MRGANQTGTNFRFLANMPRSSTKKNLAKPFQSLLPYVELCRIDKPVGILNIFFPYFYGFAFAVLTSQPTPAPSEFLPVRLPLILFSTFILRSMGCAWNDIVDMDVDKLVERTKSRPMARGAIPPSIAYGFTAGLLVIWGATLVPLTPPSINLGSYAVPLTLLVMLYPYAKRFTNYAQVILGITLAFGALFGAAFDGIDSLAILSQAVIDIAKAGDLTALKDAFDNRQVLGLVALYAIYVTWTVIHDTIYAFQDYRDDMKLGLRSTAVRLLSSAKPILSLLSIVQVLLLAEVAILLNNDTSIPYSRTVAGFFTSFIGSMSTQWPFILSTVLGNAVILAVMIIKVDLSDPRSCGWWFKTGSTLIGSSIGAGFALQYGLDIALQSLR